MAVTDRKKPEYDRLVRALRTNIETEITVGVHADAGADDNGVTLLDLANWHQFGEGNNPPRPWLTDWFDLKESRVLRAIGTEIEVSIKRGEDLNRAIRRTAVAVQADIQRFISDEASFEPNAVVTLRRKAPQTKPLIHRGIFRAGILAKVAGDVV